MQCGKFHWVLNCCAISFHSDSDLGTCVGKYYYKFHFVSQTDETSDNICASDSTEAAADKDNELDLEERSDTSTKCPTPTTMLGTPKSKRMKLAREKEENKLLEEAIGVMKYAVRHDSMRDSDAIFGEFVATELRDISDINMKRHVKFRIQTVLHETQTIGNPAVQYTQPYRPASGIY